MGSCTRFYAAFKLHLVPLLIATFQEAYEDTAFATPLTSLTTLIVRLYMGGGKPCFRCESYRPITLLRHMENAPAQSTQIMAAGSAWAGVAASSWHTGIKDHAGGHLQRRCCRRSRAALQSGLSTSMSISAADTEVAAMHAQSGTPRRRSRQPTSAR